MKIRDEAFFKTIRNFLTIYLPNQRCYSKNTVISYRTALNLFVDFLTVECGIPLHHLSFEDLKAEKISDYLDWLKAKRNCSSATRNQRLMALRSFSKYAGLMDVAQMPAIAELTKVTVQKSTRKSVEFLSEEALKALLAEPGNKVTDIRNQFFMILMYDTAARCQEILDLRLKDFVLDSKSPYIYLTGKGNKTRTVPLMQRTVGHYLHYIECFHPATTRKNDDLLFYTTIHRQKCKMSLDNAEYFMKKYGTKARQICNSIPMRVHPHQLRHTRAIHLYRGGMPLALLSEFLGHATIATTQVYAYADTEMKRAAIQKACPIVELNTAYIEQPIWKDDDEMIRRLYGLS